MTFTGPRRSTRVAPRKRASPSRTTANWGWIVTVPSHVQVAGLALARVLRNAPWLERELRRREPERTLKRPRIPARSACSTTADPSIVQDAAVHAYRSMSTWRSLSICAWAERVTRADNGSLAPSYQFAVALQRPDQHTLEFCNLDGHPQKSESKADCAAQCIRALGLKVAGNKLVDDDSWVTADTRSESLLLLSSASLQHHPAQDGGARSPIPA